MASGIGGMVGLSAGAGARLPSASVGRRKSGSEDRQMACTSVRIARPRDLPSPRAAAAANAAKIADAESLPCPMSVSSMVSVSPGWKERGSKLGSAAMT